MTSGSVCSRCGLQHVLLKTWKEKVITQFGTSELTYTQYVCPDPICQKQTNDELLLQHERHLARERDVADREKARAESRLRSIKAKK